MVTNPTEKKRQTYLNLFKDGVADGIMHGNQDQEKTWSAYYKQGYDFGVALYSEQLKEEECI